MLVAFRECNRCRKSTLSHECRHESGTICCIFFQTYEGENTRGDSGASCGHYRIRRYNAFLRELG